MARIQVHHSLKPKSKVRDEVFRHPVAWMRLLVTPAVFSVATGAPRVAWESRQPAGTEVKVECPLGLKVTSQQQQVEIRWNHDAPAALAAQKGLMRISDGALTDTIPLDRRDLQDGHISYRAITSDVRISFEVIAPDGNTVSESARAVSIR